MTKIFFPYNDQPNKISFKFPEPISFPFYVNDLVYYWEVGSDGITMYLLNNQIDQDNGVVKDILLEETGISMYLVNEQTNTSKHIFVEFAKIGMGIDTLGILDPFTLGEIDPFTLGQISEGYANWMEITASVAKAGVAKIIEASNAKMKLDSGVVLPYDKKIYTGELHEKIGIVGLNSFGHLTLGNLDPHTIGDIDAMLSTFRVFDSIPASLVKEIRITQKNSLNNNILAPIKEFETNASGINFYARSVENMAINPNVNVETSDVGYRMYINGKVNSSTNVALELTEHSIGLTNGVITLGVTVDGAE